MGVLSEIFSYGNGLKRKVNNLLADPAGTIGLGVTRFGEDQNALLNLMQNAYPMAGDKTVLNSPQQIASMRNQLADKAAEQAMSAATVWHGSPHKFDKFDSSKIGTGEGAQAYGHGLYLAESPETASFYRDKLTSSGTILSRGDALEARSNVLRKVADRVEKSDPARAAKLRSEADTFSRDGSLYKVDLPDEHIAKMLDWDKPLSQQHPDVLSSMGYHNQPRDFEAEARAVYGSPEYAQLEKLMDTRVGSAAVPDVTGKEWYRSTDDLLRGSNADEAGRSEHLRSLGIPGIRYLDEGSRATGGTSNFVVFPGNEGLLSIMERNGQPVLNKLLGK